jgi:fatty-acyl-CoA synthase
MGLRDIGESLKAMREAGLLERGTGEGTLLMIRNLLRRDFHPSTIWSLHAANLSGKEALVAGDRRLTWGEANRRINRLAHGILAMGIRPGDRLAYMLRNSTEWLEAQAACSKIGVAAAFVSYRYTAPEVEYLVKNSEARALIFGAEFGNVVEEARRNLPLPEGNYVAVGGSEGSPFRAYEDVMESGKEEEPPRSLRAGGSRVIMYTSGTTGKPKGAVRDLSGAGIGTLIQLLRIVPFRRSDRHLVSAPLYHATGSGFATTHIGLGATLLLMDKFDPVEFLRFVDREKITTTALVPTMLRSILMIPEEERRKYDVSSMRVIICTGSALPQRLKEESRAYFGDVLYDLYGSTEMGWVTVATPQAQREKPGSIGKAVPGTEVALISEAGEPVPDGQVGELFAANKLLIEGYYKNDEATRKSRWRNLFSVGDLAVRDAQGYITLVDRKTDMVISGGMNIYPAEVEDALVSHPKVLEAGVIGVPDEHWGEALLAFVVPRPGESITEDEMMDHCRKSLAGYKIPRKFHLLEELPRNPTGKILKQVLKAKYASA